MYKLTVQKQKEATGLYPDIKSGALFLLDESRKLHLKLDSGFVEIGSEDGFVYGIDFDGFDGESIQKVVLVEIIVRKA